MSFFMQFHIPINRKSPNQPFGFQSERRSLFEARDVCIQVSPTFFALTFLLSGPFYILNALAYLNIVGKLEMRAIYIALFTVAPMGSASILAFRRRGSRGLTSKTDLGDVSGLSILSQAVSISGVGVATICPMKDGTKRVLHAPVASAIGYLASLLIPSAESPTDNLTIHT